MKRNHMVEYDPFIKSQLASRNRFHDLSWRTLGHVTFENRTNGTLELHRAD